MSMSSIITSPAILPLSMSSREIAELCEKRHDNVLRDTKHMLNELEIDVPKFGGVYLGDNGEQRACLHLPKNLTLTLISGCNVQLRKRIIDRWMELEAERAPFDPSTLLNSPAMMRGLLLSYTEKVLALESEVDSMRDDVAAHERLTKADGSLSITETAKALAMRPKDLFQWLSHNGWIYKRPNGAAAPRHTRGSTPGAISDASACARALDPQAAVS
jgi:hypothetical protein